MAILQLLQLLQHTRLIKYILHLGCSENKRTAKLDLGSLLGHRDPIRGGFEKLAMEDSDGEGELDSDSDADVVEFAKASA